MSQYDFGTINPASKSGTDLAADLNSWRTAINSSHKGSTAPTYRIAGTVWLDDASTPWLDKIYDGTDWIVRGSVNASTNAYTPYLAGVAIGNSSTSAVGLIEQATSAEVLAMSSSTLAVTPSTLGALHKQGSTLTAANALSIGSGNGGLFEVDGATDVHSISDAGSPGNGRSVILRFIHATPGLLRHNVSGTERVFLPGAVDIDLKQNDIVKLTRLGANWHLTGYIPYASITLANNKLGRGYIDGLILANNGTDATNDIDISAGEARDSTNVEDMKLTATLTKRIDAAWAVGSGNGGMDTGSVADGWYHKWLIKRQDTGVVDALYSLSATAPTMPANYGLKRRVLSVLRVSSALVAFKQYGDMVLWNSPTMEYDDLTLGATQKLYVMKVPPGFRSLVKFNFAFQHASANRQGYFHSPDVADLAPDVSTPTGPLANLARTTAYNQAGLAECMTDTSQQIAARSTAASTELMLATLGWVDSRGRDA